MSYKKREAISGALWIGLIILAIINWPITLVLGICYLLIRIFN